MRFVPLNVHFSAIPYIWLAGATWFSPGAFTLRAQSPPNDLFASAQILNNPSGTVNGSNTSASKEPGEPNHVSAGGRSD